MSRYQAEYIWKEINRYDLQLAADAMLATEVRVASRPASNGQRGLVSIKFTQDPDYLDKPGDHFGKLKALNLLFDKIAPKGRFEVDGFNTAEAQYNIKVCYDLPIFSARFVQIDEATFLRHMALFDLAFLLGQAIDIYSYKGRLLKKFPDPRHKWEQAVRSRIPVLDNAARIYVPPRPRHVPLQNGEYFD